MMETLDMDFSKWELENTDERRWGPVKIDYSLDMPEEPPVGIWEEMFQEKYIIKGVIYTSFYSNRAQLGYKRSQAEKVILSYLYRDTLPLVSEIMLKSDSKEVYDLASKIEKIMTGTQDYD